MIGITSMARRVLVRWAIAYFSVVLTSNAVDLVFPNGGGERFDYPQDLFYWAVAVLVGVLVWELVRPARDNAD